MKGKEEAKGSKEKIGKSECLPEWGKKGVIQLEKGEKRRLDTEGEN